MKPTSSRIVNYVMNDFTVRPFLITRVWSDTTVNGTLFIDGSNDYQIVPNTTLDYTAPLVLTVWKTSVVYNDPSSVEREDGKTTPVANTWHWPARVTV